MRTESVQKLHAMETAALKEELQRSNVAHSQTKDRLETLYNGACLLASLPRTQPSCSATQNTPDRVRTHDSQTLRPLRETTKP